MEIVACGHDNAAVDRLVGALDELAHPVVATCRRPDLLTTVLLAVDADACVLTTTRDVGHHLDVVAGLHRHDAQLGLLLLTDAVDDVLWAALDADVIGSLGSSSGTAADLDEGLRNCLPGSRHVLGFQRDAVAAADRLS